MLAPRGAILSWLSCVAFVTESSVLHAAHGWITLNEQTKRRERGEFHERTRYHCNAADRTDRLRLYRHFQLYQSRSLPVRLSALAIGLAVRDLRSPPSITSK